MLSKTEFLHGCQCHLRLWNEVHRPGLAPAQALPTLEGVREHGAVLALARQRWEGRPVQPEPGPGTQTGEASGQAREAARRFEPVFTFQGVQVQPDMLVRADGDTWRVVAVKAAGACQPTDELELALQAWVLQHAGVALRGAEVLTLDTAYVYDGRTLDPERLFKRCDRTRPVAGKAGAIGMEVVIQQAVLARPEPPEVPPGRHCFEPHACPFHAHCTRGLPKPSHPLSELPRLSRARQEDLEAAGCTSIEAIPASFELTPMQQRVRACVRADRAWMAPALGEALAGLQYPIHSLDFETFSPALPRFPGMRPFQRVPCQWSCHSEDRPGSLRHQAFRVEDGADPRERLVRSLLEALGTQGSICVYSGLEGGVIQELAEALPALAQPLGALLPRLADILVVVA